MDNRQRGAASGLAITLIVIILIAIFGIGFWWYHEGHVASDTTTVATTSTSTSPGYTFTIGTTTSSTIASNTTSQPKTRTVTYTTYERKQVAGVAGAGISGSTYHNATYGLSMRIPGFRSYETAGGPSGLPGTIQIHFVAPGENADAFVVNVWSKAGWNYVRTQENFVHLNTNNIGEGTYLGENFTWIYSYTIYSHVGDAQAALSGAVFY